MNKTLSFVTVLVLVAIAIFLFLIMRSSSDVDYKVWPVTINQLSKTEKLKVITFHKEILASEHRLNKGLFSNSEDKLYVIYPATLNLGFDLSKCDDNTFQRIGEDTVVVTLPPVEVLNKDGLTIDEAEKHTAIEKGEWSNEALANLKKRAEAIMKRSCEYDDCYRKAEAMGEIMVRAMVEKLGFPTVIVKIKPRKEYGLALSGERYGSSTPYKFYQAGGRRFLLLKAKGNAGARRMYYPGATFTYPQLLALGDFFNDNLASGEVEVKKTGQTLVVSFKHGNVVAGSSEAVAITKKSNPKTIASWNKLIAQDIFHNALQLKVNHIDKNGKVLYTYPN